MPLFSLKNVQFICRFLCSLRQAATLILLNTEVKILLKKPVTGTVRIRRVCKLLCQFRYFTSLPPCWTVKRDAVHVKGSNVITEQYVAHDREM